MVMLLLHCLCIILSPLLPGPELQKKLWLDTRWAPSPVINGVINVITPINRIITPVTHAYGHLIYRSYNPIYNW